MAWEPDYVTVEQLSHYLKETEGVELDDDFELALWVTSASRSCDNFTGRQFGKVDVPATWTVTGTWSRADQAFTAAIPDLRSAAGLVVNDGAADLAADRFKLYPVNQAFTGRPYERITVPGAGSYAVTSDQWGWAEVPRPVQLAALIQGARLAFRQDAPHGIAGSPEQGSEQRLLATLDPDLKTSLKPYVRKWWAA